MYSALPDAYHCRAALGGIFPSRTGEPPSGCYPPQAIHTNSWVGLARFPIQAGGPIDGSDTAEHLPIREAGFGICIRREVG